MITLVPCCGKKLDHPAPARELYRSTTFIKMRAYAEALGHPWCILSAHYYLVDPDQVIAPYDKTLTGAPKRVRDAWGARVRMMFTTRYPGHFALNLCGKNYASGLADLVVQSPLDGMASGYQLQWLNTKLRELQCTA